MGADADVALVDPSARLDGGARGPARPPPAQPVRGAARCAAAWCARSCAGSTVARDGRIVAPPAGAWCAAPPRLGAVTAPARRHRRAGRSSTTIPARAGSRARSTRRPTPRALEWVAERMRAAGLETRLDAVGNLFGRWTGADAGARDRAHRLARRHDAQRGALRRRRWGCSARSRRSARCARPARARGARSRSSPGRARSRASGPAAWAAARPRASCSARTSTACATATARAWPTRCAAPGFDPDRLADARIDPATVHALVELHIEQGIVLETHGEQIGVVTAIAAPHDFRLTFRGAATHAGATPMGLRRDALAGAAEAMVALERAARESPSGTTVGTVGVLRARPGRDQRRARRGRARRRRARQRPRGARAGGRRDPRRRARDRRAP